MQYRGRIACASLILSVLLLTVLILCELYVATRFESQYVPASEYSTRSYWILRGIRTRGTLLEFDGRGFHVNPPDLSPEIVTERLKNRYPNDYDAKKVTWVLRDEEAAFFYKLVPNWAGVAFLFSVFFLIGIFPAHIFLARYHSPYLFRGRLADVLALTQVLAFDRCSHRSESGLCSELQGKPASSQTWSELAKAHPELFRVKSSGNNVVSLVARHVEEPQGQGRDPLSAECVAGLLKLAVEVHDRELARARGWQVWVPLIVTVVAGVFTVVGAVISN